MDGGRDGWRKGEMEEGRERGKGIINVLKGRDSKMWKESSFALQPTMTNIGIQSKYFKHTLSSVNTSITILVPQ